MKLPNKIKVCFSSYTCKSFIKGDETQEVSINNIDDFELFHEVGNYGNQLRVWFKIPVKWRGNEQRFARVRYQDNSNSFISKLKKAMYEHGRRIRGRYYDTIKMKLDALKEI
jgi:hypothetical protein